MPERFSVITRVLLGFTLLFSFFEATAQYRLEGVVKDAGNNQPLIGVTIQFSGGGTTTDIEGRFALDFKEKQMLRSLSVISATANWCGRLQ